MVVLKISKLFLQISPTFAHDLHYCSSLLVRSQCHSVKAPLGQNKQVVSYWVVYGRVLHVLRPLLVLLIPN